MCIKKLFLVAFSVLVFLSSRVSVAESPTTKVVTGTADIAEGFGFEGTSRTAYVANEESRISSQGKKEVLNSWVDAYYSGPAANHAGGFLKRILEVGSSAGEYGKFQGFWSANAVCTEKNSVGACLRHSFLFGAWAQDETGKATTGIFSRDSVNHSIRLVVPVETEKLDSGDFVWSAYDPKGILVDFWYRSPNETIQADTQFLVLANGTCGSSKEDAVPCLVASVEYRQGTVKRLFLVAKEGMPELGNGKLEHSWNTAFYGGVPLNRGVNELQEAAFVFTAVFVDEKTGNSQEGSFISFVGFHANGPSIQPVSTEAVQ